MRSVVTRSCLALAALLACGMAAAAGGDPYFESTGSWQQGYADQWGLHRIGFGATAEVPSAWQLAATRAQATPPKPVIVAIVDTGIDFTHADLARENLWSNEAETPNGVDDDRNGYIDDLIGWNFADGNNNPWDRAGHGTHVAGIIGARTGNGFGVAGIDPLVRLMPLKVLNAIGRGRSAHIAAAIHYAVANGARVVNLSLGGENLSAVEQRAIAHAAQSGVIVVVAAGNLGRDTAGFGMADLPGVLTVTATDPDDRRAPFANFGRAVKIAAPGVDILSLRARDTDLIQISGAAHYREGAATVGNDFYRVSGTSFAAAMVSGVTSWLLSQRPELTGVQAARMIVQSARDIGAPGVDALTGYGIVDARAALAADPNFRIEAAIADVDLSIRDGQPRVRVLGTVDADRFAAARVQAAPEAFPQDWIDLAPPLAQPARNATLAEAEPRALRGARRWIVRALVTHENGKTREARFTIDLGEAPDPGEKP